METKWMMRNKFQLAFWIIFAASLFTLFGCSTAGKTVPLEERIPLVSHGIQSGEQMVGDIKITFTYQFYQKSPDLSGLLEIDGYALLKSGSVYTLRVSIHFLNGEGKILETKILSTGGAHNGDIWRFQRKLEVPTGTADISFGANIVDQNYRPPTVR